MKLIGMLAAAFVTLAILANWLASAYIVTVPATSHLVPAGTFAIGAILVIRDWLQQAMTARWGWRKAVLASVGLIVLAGVASYITAEAAGWVSLQKIATASLIAFLVSEGLELAVFTPIRRRSLSLGVALSGSVGLVVDSVLFLWLAFGSLAYLDGQLVTKAVCVGIGVALTAARRTFAPVTA